MRSERKVVPRWMRTTAKVGLVMGVVLVIAMALAHNWLVALGMVAFTLLHVSMLTTTKSDT